MIETPRLRLRNWRPEDAEPFWRHLDTEPVMRWLGGVKGRDFYDWLIVDRLIGWQVERGFTLWAVERKDDRALLGFCGLKISSEPNSPVNGEIEIAWRLREDCWGQGYAKEAAVASLDFAFGSLGAPRVVALTVEGNRASWGLMERLGMRRRPELDFVGAEWAEGTVIVYDIAREVWRDDPD